MILFYFCHYLSTNTSSLRDYLHTCYTDDIISEDVSISPKFLLCLYDTIAIQENCIAVFVFNKIVLSILLISVQVPISRETQIKSNLCLKSVYFFAFSFFSNFIEVKCLHLKTNLVVIFTQFKRKL